MSLIYMLKSIPMSWVQNVSGCIWWINVKMKLGIVLASAACRAQSAANTDWSGFVFRTAPLFLFKNNKYMLSQRWPAITDLLLKQSINPVVPLKLLSLYVCHLGGGEVSVEFPVPVWPLRPCSWSFLITKIQTTKLLHCSIQYMLGVLQFPSGWQAAGGHSA